jgi:SAM-dependent methyltransferase
MHPEVTGFLNRMKVSRPDAFSVRRVLEAGSLDVNGTPRSYFKDATEYVGVDWRPGPGVDKVSLMHEYNGHAPEHFDTVISTEMLEHDPHWESSLVKMIGLLKPGGNLIVTAAGRERDPHCIETSPKAGYYNGLDLQQLLQAVTGKTMWMRVRWAHIHAEDDPVAKDVRVAAFGKMG